MDSIYCSTDRLNVLTRNFRIMAKGFMEQRGLPTTEHEVVTHIVKTMEQYQPILKRDLFFKSMFPPICAKVYRTHKQQLAPTRPTQPVDTTECAPCYSCKRTFTARLVKCDDCDTYQCLNCLCNCAQSLATGHVRCKDCCEHDISTRVSRGPPIAMTAHSFMGKCSVCKGTHTRAVPCNRCTNHVCLNCTCNCSRCSKTLIIRCDSCCHMYVRK